MKLQSIIKILFLLLFSIFLIFIFARFFGTLSFPNVEDKLLEDGKVRLFPNRPVFQIFTAQKNGLNQIDIAIRNFNSWNSDKISFQLKDSACDETIANNEVSIFSPDYTIYTPFTFSEISDSQGRVYCAEFILLTKNENQVEELLPFIVYSRAKGTSFTNSGEEELGEKKIYSGKTLVMKPAYGSGSFWKNMETLNDRISQYKPWFLKHYYLGTIAILFVVLSIGLVTVLVLL